MDSGKNTFCPKMQREMSLETKCSCRLKNMAMFMLDYPILLRRINARVLIWCAILSEKILIEKIPPLSTLIFAMDALNWVLTKEKKKCEQILCFMFMMHKKYPYKSRIIIHNCQKIFSTGNRSDFIRASNVTMD